MKDVLGKLKTFFLTVYSKTTSFEAVHPKVFFGLAGFVIGQFIAAAFGV
jgi:hypothetical protein